ncbi:hypothetical protein JCM19236_6310 [Vibrio sp. JCM 19236]|nr:hypothetical protein JCM19236_6310 [Vibrio sp. JCM 19236]
MGNSGTISGLNKHSIAIDYDAISDLEINYGSGQSITIEKASLLKCLIWLLTHSDLTVRLSMRFAVLGAFARFCWSFDFAHLERICYFNPAGKHYPMG